MGHTSPESPDARAIADRVELEEPGAVDEALAYLVRDPWGFRTGYDKAVLLRRLKHVELDDAQSSVARGVLLRYVDVGPRWDFREACTLARHIADRSTLDGLRVRLHGTDQDRSYRALQMLFRLHHPRLRDVDLAKARSVVLAMAASRVWWHHAPQSWIERLWSEAWREELIADAGAAPPTDRSVGAREILRRAGADVAKRLDP